jgi:site-specific DNA-cytosine methylase
MRYLSVCSGIEAATVAWGSLGWQPVAFAEIDPFACAVLAHHYPEVPNLGDFTKIGPEDVGAIDLLVGGTPCFASGTLVTLDRGLVPIEEVRVGDRALTHEGTFERVSAVGSKSAPTVRVRGQSGDVTTTADHRFWSSSTMSRSTRRGGVAARETTRSEPGWTAAKDLVGAHVATPTVVPMLPVPPVSALGREREGPAISEQFMWCAGAWLGDGWTRVWEGGRRGAVVVCAARGPQARELERNMRDVFGSVTLTQERTTERLAAYSLATVRWLRENFGSGAAGKTVPTWLLGAPEGLRRAFLAGYLFADGSTMPNGRRCTTVSPRVALGIAMLAHTLGFSTSRYETRVDPTTVIEGRTVTQRPWWQVSIYDRARSSWTDGRHRFGLCRSVEPTGRTETVHDLTVERSNSYVAAGLVVHNCQDFSVAGLRAGLAGDRGQLAIEFARLAARLRPRWLIWENVPGVLSADKGGAFGIFLGALAECGYGFAYRVLDAQNFGVPQRRRRVFVVGHLGEWRRAAAVLFERESLSWNTPPRKKARKDIAGTLGARTSAGGGFGTDFDLDGVLVESYSPGSFGTYSEGIKALRAGSTGAGKDALLVAHTLRGEGHDASEDGTGRGVPLTISFGAQADLSPTLRAMSHRDSHQNAGGQITVPFSQNSRDEIRMVGGDGGVVGALSAETGMVAFTCKQDGTDAGAVSPTLRSMNHADSHANGGGQVAITVPLSGVRRLTPRECTRLQGFPDDYLTMRYADAEEAHTAQILHELWNAAGAIAREGWRPGVVAALLTPEILLAGVYGGWVSWKLARRCAAARRTLQGAEPWPEGFVFALRDGEERRSSPYRRESFEQCARELGRPLSSVPPGRASCSEILRRSGLWAEAQALWPLRYALATPSQIEKGRIDVADGLKYRALGNSMAVPVMRWIGERIAMVDAIFSRN